MPALVTLELGGNAVLPPADQMGPLIHAAVLDAVRAHSPVVADALHGPTVPKPYAIQPIERRGHGWAVPIGVQIDHWVDGLADALRGAGWVRLGDSWLPVDGVQVHLRPWRPDDANAIPTQRWRLDLRSPASVRGPGRPGQPRIVDPLPSSSRLLEGLHRRWVTFGGPPLPHLDSDPAAVPLVVSGFELRSAWWVIKRPATRMIGAVGKLDVRLVGPAAEVMATDVDALLGFAATCGIGDQTTKGMGAVNVARMNK